LTNAGVNLDLTAVNVSLMLYRAVNESTAALRFMLDLGADPNSDSEPLPLLTFALLWGFPNWRPMAEMIIEAGGSLRFGMGAELDADARKWVYGATGLGRCEQVKFALALPSKALCGVDLPESEFQRLVGLMRTWSTEVSCALVKWVRRLSSLIPARFALD
jgi:hypothetical protein